MDNQINCKCPRVLIIHFYRLIRFCTRRHFYASLSARVSDSGHPIMYTRTFCTNNPGHKIYRYMSARSTQQHTLLHNPTNLHMNTFLRQPITCARKIVQDKTITVFANTPMPASRVIVHFKI